MLKTIALGLTLAVSSAVSAADFDFSNPKDSLAAFLKMRASLDPEVDTVTYWKGTLYAQVPGERLSRIMGFEGFNIARVEPQEDGNFRFITREVTYYSDLKTGEIIETWANPYSGENNEVLQVQNDPVNNLFRPMPFPFTVTGDDVQMLLDVPLAYPNPLQPEVYPAESSGPMYVGSEHFSFVSSKADINNPKMDSVPMTLTWFRTGPWLPWMKLGTKPGGLVYSGHGRKLMNGVADLPPAMAEYTRKHFPEYLTAPSDWSKPNDTSWTVYRDKHPVSEAD